MKSAGGGTIVNLASTASFWGVPDLVPYTSAKHGILGLTKSLGAALGEHGIRVNAVAPGAVMTRAADASVAHARNAGRGRSRGRPCTLTSSRTTSPMPSCSCPRKIPG